MPSPRAALISMCLVAGAAACAAQAAPAEEVAFSSLDGTPLKAWLFKPAGAARGTVVALHGCDGLYASSGRRQGLLNARHQGMADLLVDAGFVALFPDSLTPRGERELCTQRIGQRRVNQPERRADALAALAWAAQQPGAAPQRVALLGWSHGGSAVLSATDATHASVRAQAQQPVLAVAFYPGCSAPLKTGWKPSAPVLLLLGALDDWTPPEPCVALARRSGSEVHVFEDSYHAFDAPQGSVRLRTGVPNGMRPGQGVHAGPNPAARAQAYALLRERLDMAFGAAGSLATPAPGR
jgi:dienelactone hydrolase